jgi:hypothetical protein
VSVPVLRPLGIGEILDIAIKITTRHWWTLVRIVLVVVVPLQVLAAAIDISASEGVVTTGGQTGFDESGEIDPDQVWTFVAAAIVAFVLTLLAQTIATGACFKAVGDAYLGREPSWRGSLGATVRRLHSIVWVSVLAYVLAVIAAIACLLPGVWLFIAWTVAVPALLTEDVRGIKALRRSFGLVRHFWWRTFALVVLGTMLASIVGLALGGALGALTFNLESDAAVIVANLVASVLAGVVATPFVAAMTIVLYIDLRVRKEGFDLALLAERFGEPGAFSVPMPPAPAAPSFGTGGSQPPYWPPPPGWRPDGDEQ